jgi:hypothetical protein
MLGLKIGEFSSVKSCDYRQHLSQKNLMLGKDVKIIITKFVDPGHYCMNVSKYVSLLTILCKVSYKSFFSFDPEVLQNLMLPIFRRLIYCVVENCNSYGFNR